MGPLTVIQEYAKENDLGNYITEHGRIKTAKNSFLHNTS
jgi:hypothetical protein